MSSTTIAAAFPAPSDDAWYPGWSIARPWAWEAAANAWHRDVQSSPLYINGEPGLMLSATQTAREDGTITTHDLTFDAADFDGHLVEGDGVNALADLATWAIELIATIKDAQLEDRTKRVIRAIAADPDLRGMDTDTLARILCAVERADQSPSSLPSA